MPSEDILGFQVYDCFGSFVGVVEDLLADVNNPKVISYVL
ncbi:MAG: PRC-barrel domain-containing protein, partial [Candidatus Aquicultor sp.]